MKHNNAMMDTAIRWAKESYCRRRQVGAVVAKGRDPLSVGFNGTISGQENVCEVIEPFKTKEEMETHNPEFVVECPECKGSTMKRHPYSPIMMECDRCNGLGYMKDTDITNKFTLHAEYNAIIRASKKEDLEGASIYITLAPCTECAKLIASHKISHVYYKDDYDMEGIEFLKSCNINVTQLKLED